MTNESASGMISLALAMLASGKKYYFADVSNLSPIFCTAPSMMLMIICLARAALMLLGDKESDGKSVVVIEINKNSIFLFE